MPYQRDKRKNRRIISAILVIVFTAFSAAPPDVLADTIDISYDAAGNMTQKGDRTYEYDDEGRLKRIREDGQPIAEFHYDYQGRRIRKITGGRVTLYPEKHYVVDSESGATSYYYLYNERIAEKDGSGRRFFYHPDHLGGVSIVTDESGNLVRCMRYYPYGLTRVEESTEEEPLRHQFTGQEKDPSARLYYYGARYYDPQLRRFISPDPVLPIAGLSQTVNPYAYCMNNPVKHIDPNGDLVITLAVIVKVLGIAMVAYKGFKAEAEYAQNASNPTWYGLALHGGAAATVEAFKQIVAKVLAPEAGITNRTARLGLAEAAAVVLENLFNWMYPDEGTAQAAARGVFFAEISSFLVALLPGNTGALSEEAGDIIDVALELAWERYGGDKKFSEWKKSIESELSEWLENFEPDVIEIEGVVDEKFGPYGYRE